MLFSSSGQGEKRELKLSLVKVCRGKNELIAAKEGEMALKDSKSVALEVSECSYY